MTETSQNMTTVPLVESNKVSPLGTRNLNDTGSDKDHNDHSKYGSKGKGYKSKLIFWRYDNLCE